jgi:diamine N-acetyltransferase
VNAAGVSLREVTRETLGPILRLKTTPAQERFVASNAVSIAQAHFAPETTWYRGIYAGEEPVGFVMLHVDAAKPEYWVWRLMIGADHQRKGYGRQAMEQVIGHVRALPDARELLLSIVKGDGSPAPFYESLGFEFTGEVSEGEHVMRLGF